MSPKRDRRTGVLRQVEHEVGVIAPGRKEPILEAGLGDPLEIDRRNDLVGVHIAAPQRKSGAGVAGERIHDHRLLIRSAGELSVPVTAVAAATSGETR